MLLSEYIILLATSYFYTFYADRIRKYELFLNTQRHAEGVLDGVGIEVFAFADFLEAQVGIEGTGGSVADANLQVYGIYVLRL